MLLDQDGNIAENVGGNFMIVTDGAIRTPGDQSILQGISRMTVFDLADQLGIPIVEEDLQPYDAYTADEAFLTNSIYQLLPVASIDGRNDRRRGARSGQQETAGGVERTGGRGHRGPGAAGDALAKA